MSYNYDQRTPKLNTLTYQPSRPGSTTRSRLRCGSRSGLTGRTGIRVTRDQYSGYTLEGLTNSKGNQMPWITTMSASANYNIGSHTFIEAIWGRTQNFYASPLTGELTNRYAAGLEGVPDIYSTNRDINPDYWMYGALSDIVTPFFLNGRNRAAAVRGLGHAVGEHAGHGHVSGVRQRQPDVGPGGQRDPRARAAHHQGRRRPQPQLQGPEHDAGRAADGLPQLRRERQQPVQHGLRLRQCNHGSLRHLLPGLEVHRIGHPVHWHRAVPSRTTGRSTTG